MTYEQTIADKGYEGRTLVYKNEADYNSDPSRTEHDESLVPVEDSQTAHVSIPAATTAYTMDRDIEYSHKPSASTTYTLYTPTDTGLAHSIALQLNTDDASTIAFQSSGGSPLSVQGGTIVADHTYIIFGSWDYTASRWILWLRDYGAN